MLNITMLGTGGGIPVPGRYLSSMIINYKGRKILIDAGEGTQVAMREFHTGFRSLDIICLTHFHGDHIFGLPGLLTTLSNSDRIKPLTIIGPEGLKRIVDGLLASLNLLHFEIKFIENPRDLLCFKLKENILEHIETETGNYDLEISTLELEHSCDCIGYSFYVPRLPEFNPEAAIKNNIPKHLWSKLQRGAEVKINGETYLPDIVLGEARRGIKLSFITDTRPIKEIIPFIKESDLFVCEGTYGDSEDREKAVENHHMTFKEAAILAEKADVKKLLITHFSAGIKNPEIYINNTAEVFPNTVVAYDGISETIRFSG